MLHIITRMDKGGSAENTLLTVLGLNKERYDVTLVKGTALESVMGDCEKEAHERDLKKALDSGVKIITLNELVRRVSPLSDLKSFIRLFSIIRQGNYHVVHTHTSKAGIIGRWAAWFCRTPVIIHTPHGHIFYGYYGKFITWLFRLIERFTAIVTDRIITLTDRCKQEHIDFKIAPPEKFLTIHSGVEIGRFLGVSTQDTEKIRNEFHIPNTYLIVGTVGRLTEVKGHTYFINAASEVLKDIKNIKFMITGDGPLKPDLKREADLLNISDEILFTGWRGDIPALLSVLDIFVLPSLNEGMGKVLIEAMLLKKPVIASRVGGIPDLIRDGENGILVKPASPHGLAGAMLSLIKSEDKRKEMGLCGRGIAESYSSEKMVQNIERLYEDSFKPRTSTKVRGKSAF
ncbi:MAG: glycosyltransferase family 4 protein [Nitrospinota bacterium]